MRTALFVVGCIIAFMIALSALPRDARQKKIESATTPSELVSAAVDKSDAQVTVTGPTIKVVYNLAEVLTARSARSEFNNAMVVLIPALFAKFPALTKAEVTALAAFGDAKGNRSTDPVFRIMFTKTNAATINWPNVITSNIPKIADYYWAHPSVLRE